MYRLFAIFVLLSSTVLAADVPRLTPTEAAKRVEQGLAVLVDVREPSEWHQTGVAAPAVLLPKSDFDAGMIGDWKAFMEQVGEKQIILYCRSGRRSGTVAAALAAQGHPVANAGSFKDWEAAQLPTRQLGSDKR